MDQDGARPPVDKGVQRDYIDALAGRCRSVGMSVTGNRFPWHRLSFVCGRRRVGGSP